MITVHTPESTWLMTEQLITNTDQLTFCVWIVVIFHLYYLCILIYWGRWCLVWHVSDYVWIYVSEYYYEGLGLYNVEVWFNFSFISWLCLSCLRRKIRGKKPGEKQFNSGSRKERFFSWGFCNIRQFVISEYQTWCDVLGHYHYNWTCYSQIWRVVFQKRRT